MTTPSSPTGTSRCRQSSRQAQPSTLALTRPPTLPPHPSRGQMHATTSSTATTSSSTRKMRIEALVSAQSSSPSTPKAIARFTPVSIGTLAPREPREEGRRPLQLLLREATRVALEDDDKPLDSSRQHLSERPHQLSPQTVCPVSSLLGLAPPTSLSLSSSSRSAPSSPTSSVNPERTRRNLTLSSEGGGAKQLCPLPTNASPASMQVDPQSHLSSSPSSLPISRLHISEASGVPLSKEGSATLPPAIFSSPTMKRFHVVQLSHGSRRPLLPVDTNARPTSGCPSPLKRTHSFPPPSLSTPTNTLNLRKRSRDEAAISPATANGARILVHSLPNVKIHMQKRIKLTPKPAGQVQPRPEGVRNVLVYHF